MTTYPLRGVLSILKKETSSHVNRQGFCSPLSAPFILRLFNGAPHALLENNSGADEFAQVEQQLNPCHTSLVSTEGGGVPVLQTWKKEVVAEGDLEKQRHPDRSMNKLRKTMREDYLKLLWDYTIDDIRKFQPDCKSVFALRVVLTVPISYEVERLSPLKTRKCGKGEYKEAALCLAKSSDDDVAMYFAETGDAAHWTREKKWDLHVSILEYLVYGHILKGLVTTIGPNYDCVAPCGMWRLQYGFKFSAKGYKRYFREFMPLLHKTKHEVLGHHEDDSWYLVYIGTKPDARGKGYARALIESATKEADAENRYYYLESGNGINPKI
ncbi:hypothetical protein MMC07_000049 [Pseudocyphellaria aurata]|nr:hypothetical protein [Pseudocyphellaria aurata]